ncbi:MAG TPA: hypothetical protein VGD22_03890 [Sphingobacteriaceae bacterium]
MQEIDVIRHLLATISYRLAKSVNQVNPEFYELAPPNGIRKPKEILRHMSQVLMFSISVLDHTTPTTLNQEDGKTELKRFYLILEQLDELLIKTAINPELTLQFIQGPMADTLTHIGQIAMLRRYYNDPVRGENFMKAKIKMGKLKLDEQDLNNVPFD